jgi:energy-coupling factor transporter ATP-binding protein EcfA2
VSNLLSFREFELDLNDRLTVLVGPNGAGKTNLARVLDLVSKLVDWADERSRSGAAPPTPSDAVLSSYLQARHDQSAPEGPIEVRLEVDMCEPAERARITAFVRAAILSTLSEESHSGDEAQKTRLAAWVMNEFSADKLAPLFRGSLAFRHPGYADALWEARYEVEIDGESYDWVLYTPSYWASIVPRGAPSDLTTPEVRLWEALFGQVPTTSPPLALPDPLPPFELKSLCPPAGKKLTNLVVRLGTGAFNDQHEPFRTAASRLGFPASGAVGQQAFGLARALRINLAEGLIVLGEQFRGLGIGGTIPWRAGLYTWELMGAPAPARDPGFLPLRLFRLKNGATAEDRETFTKIQSEFSRLAQGKSFDVTFTAASMPVQTTGPIGAGQVALADSDDDGRGQTQPGSIITVVAWNRPDKADASRRERPIQLFGAGTWEALVLAEALVNCQGRLTVLDEPGATLHPTWQSTLRAELQAAAGQILLITHSPSLVPMETLADLRSLVRMSNTSGASKANRLRGDIPLQASAKMTRTFALSMDARALLFSRGAVVVSGETELGALPTWCAKSRSAQQLGTPSDLDIAFLSVGGDTGFGNVLSVLDAFGISWVLVCDGKSFDVASNWSNQIFRQIQRAGIDIPELRQFTVRLSSNGAPNRAMTEELWTEQLSLGATHGIYTLVGSWKGGEESVESFFEKAAPGKLTEATAEVGSGSKIRLGRWVAQETPCPKEIDQLYERLVERFVERNTG